jgi:hypothetical protein
MSWNNANSDGLTCLLSRSISLSVGLVIKMSILKTQKLFLYMKRKNVVIYMYNVSLKVLTAMVQFVIKRPTKSLHPVWKNF